MQRHHGEITYYLPDDNLVDTTASFKVAELSRELRFIRLFPDLDRFRPDEALLSELGAAMGESSSGGDHPELPAGYTYLGQFIDHDITADLTEGLPDAELEPEEIVQGRTPSLDLDSLYGRGPDNTQLAIYESDGVRLQVGTTSDVQQLGVFPNDLPRAADGTAQIGDPRNDENLAVAQLHLAMIKFHNKVVETLAEEEGLSDGALFDAARETVTRHYQWIVLHDFLRRVAHPDVVDDVLANGRQFYTPEPDREPAMPIEFSVAAYRFGHSMVRDVYSWNRIFVEDGTLANLFRFTVLNGDMAGLPTLPSNWIVDWRRMFPVDPSNPHARLNFARPIDTALADSLGSLPNSGNLPTRLAVRNLMRGGILGLPTGQDLARAVGATPLSPEEVAGGRHGQVLSSTGFDEQTPLWYYILREAEVQSNSERLGEVGSRILAETFHGLIENSAHSILKSEWAPTLPSAQDDHFDMADLLNFVDDINPLG